MSIKENRIFRSIMERTYWVPALIVALIAIIITYLLFNYTQILLRNRLEERLSAIAATSALLFDSNEIAQLKEMGLESINTEIYKANVFKMQAIRNANKDIKYVYILGTTSNPQEVVFIADADAISINPTIDFNEDGIIDDEDVSHPGEIYDASEVPALQGEAFKHTTVDDELTIDEWGTFLSGYSPIIDNSGNAVGTLTIDVEVTDYLRLIKATFLPFILFIGLLSLLLVALTSIIARIWKTRVEIVKELDRQKDELLSIVSHQLATPVTSVKWYIEMLLDGDLGPIKKEQKDHLEKMKLITGKLVDLVSMILDVSRIQLGRVKVEKQDLDLNNFFKELIAVIEPRALEKGVNLIKKVPKELPVAKLDKRLTNMTLENLLSNAIKYTPKDGEVELRVEVKGAKISILVKDTGCGIPESDQGKIFGKLFRASNVRNEIEGNGFGLYVAKGAVENQGGTIQFKSTEGKGTTFFVELPIRST